MENVRQVRLDEETSNPDVADTILGAVGKTSAESGITEWIFTAKKSRLEPPEGSKPRNDTTFEHRRYITNPNELMLSLSRGQKIPRGATMFIRATNSWADNEETWKDNKHYVRHYIGSILAEEPRRSVAIGRLYQLPEPAFTSLAAAIDYLRGSGEKSTLVLRCSGELGSSGDYDRKEVRYCGHFHPDKSGQSRCGDLEDLIPRHLRVSSVVDGKSVDCTEEAMRLGKSSVPIAGGYVLRSVSGRAGVYLKLVKIESASEFRGYLKKATLNTKPTSVNKGTFDYLAELMSLRISREYGRFKVEGGWSRLTIDYSTRTKGDTTKAILAMFAFASQIKGFEWRPDPGTEKTWDDSHSLHAAVADGYAIEKICEALWANRGNGRRGIWKVCPEDTELLISYATKVRNKALAREKAEAKKLMDSIGKEQITEQITQDEKSNEHEDGANGQLEENQGGLSCGGGDGAEG